jgi:hypothetical protein
MPHCRYFEATLIHKTMTFFTILTQLHDPIKIRRFCWILSFSLFSSACTPHFDWRSSKLNSHGDQYTITFPGKSLNAEKLVTLAGHPYPLMLSAVQVDSAQFALGSIPASNAAQAKMIANALADAFSFNLQLTTPPQRSTVLLAKNSEGFDITYPVIDERYAQARFMWTEHAAYELLVIGKTKDVTIEVADTFIRSMQFE